MIDNQVIGKAEAVYVIDKPHKDFHSQLSLLTTFHWQIKQGNDHDIQSAETIYQKSTMPTCFRRKAYFLLGHAPASLLPFVFTKVMLPEFSDFPRPEYLVFKIIHSLVRSLLHAFMHPYSRDCSIVKQVFLEHLLWARRRTRHGGCEAKCNSPALPARDPLPILLAPLPWFCLGDGPTPWTQPWWGCPSVAQECPPGI